MFNFYFAFHIIVVVSWVLFLLQFIKAYQHQNRAEAYIFGILSLFFLIITFYLGVKLIMFNTAILKSGGWLHLKITLAVILAIENLYYFVKFLLKKTISKKIAELNYWISYLIFVFILYLTLFRPF